jgi:parallel beta-helix repeat protein
MQRAFRARWFLRIVGGLLVVAALLAIRVQASPETRYVAPGGDCGGASPCYAEIQAAVQAAVNGDEIRIAGGTYSQVSTAGDITAVVRIVDRKITLRGGYAISDWNTSDPDAHPTVIDAGDQGIGVFINYQADIGIGEIVVDGVSITGGNATQAGAGTDSGGGVFVDHTTHVRVTIQNCKIYQNTAEDGSGGGIWTTRSDNLHLLDSEITDNAGSGVVVTYGDNTVIAGNVVSENVGIGISVISDLGDGTDVRDNQVTGNQGSGINLNTATGGSLTGNLVANNHTSSGGGGLDIAGAIGDFLISDNTVRENSALQGGGINIRGSIARIQANRVESNTTTPSSNGGGGLYVDAGASGAYVLVSGNQVLSNSTSNQGGGLLVLGHVDVLGNTIQGNSASSGGGMVAAATGTIGDNLIGGNTAGIGGGIRVVNPRGLLLERNRIIGNQATDGDGGGMSLWGGFFMDLALDGSQVFGNSATTKGGGIYLECPVGVDPVDLSNIVLADNLAATGSGLYLTNCDANIAYSTVASNRGEGGDGIGFYLRDPSGGDASYSLENSIVVDQATGVYVESGSAALEATFWGSGDWANDADTGGPGTIDPGTYSYQGDPAFVDPANQDYHIEEGSPVIDKGVDTWVSVDMDGQGRPLGKTDIGADEYAQEFTVYLPMVVNQ